MRQSHEVGWEIQLLSTYSEKSNKKILFSNQLLQRRLAAGIRFQKDLSRITGIHNDTICEYERNRRPIKLAHAIVFSVALGCPLGELVRIQVVESTDAK